MDQVPTIRLAAGTRTVPLSTVPTLIARAIHPDQPEGHYFLQSMGKAYLGPNGELDGRTLPCSDDDLRLVVDILGAPLPIGKEILAAHLEELQQRFAQSTRRLDWVLSPLVIDKAFDAHIFRMNAEDSHRRALIDAIRNGSLAPLDHSFLPLDNSIREALDLGQVFLETFKRYVAEFGISVVVGGIGSQRARIVVLVDLSELIASTVDKILNVHPERWQKQGHNNDIRRDIARALVERDLLDQLQQKITAGTVIPRNSRDGSAIAGPLDFGFACDIHWSVTQEEAALFVQDFATFPAISEASLDSAAQEAEERREVSAARQAAKEAAGRYTLKEATAQLARATGIQPDRWKKTILESVRKGELPLRNPQDFSDNLPYQLPKQLYSFFEQVDSTGLNEWLESHPEWGINYRFPASASACPTAEAPAAKKTKRQQWNEDIVRALSALGHEPRSLPPSPRGKPGVRAEVASKLVGKERDKKKFERAWENALSDGVIAFRR